MELNDLNKRLVTNPVKGIHFHVSVTPDEFKHIQTSLDKIFHGKVKSCQVISHKHYMEYNQSNPFSDEQIFETLTEIGRKQRPEFSPGLVIIDNYPNISYFFLRDKDIEFGVLEISWVEEFEIKESKTIIEQVLNQLFLDLKQEVFGLYFENLYPLLMDRIKGLEQEIIEKEKSELAVDLIEGIAHSIANPLSVIYANLEITEEMITKNPHTKYENGSNSFLFKVKKEDYDELNSIFEDQKKAVKRITNVISELRMFSSAYKGDIESVDISNVLRLSLSFSQLRLKLQGKIELNLNSSARIYASLFIVSQVIYNILKIIVNSQEKQSDKIIITSTDQEDDPTIIISSQIIEEKIDILKFSFIDNFLHNIPHDSNINIENDKITVHISFKRHVDLP